MAFLKRAVERCFDARKPGLLRTCPGTPSQRRAGDPLFSGKAWPTENVTLIGRRSPLRTETRQRLRRAESYRHVASYAESRLREGNPNSIRLGFEHAPRFAGFVCPNPALSALCNPENSGRRAETYIKSCMRRKNGLKLQGRYHARPLESPVPPRYSSQVIN